MTFNDSIAGSKRRGGVADVVRSGLCVGCGACAFMEPSLSMVLDGRGQLTPSALPSADSDPVCPFSDHAPSEDSIARTRGLDVLPHHKKIGYHHSNWVGHVIEGSFREQASSGGLTTWLVAELFKKTEAKAVLHAHYRQQDPDRIFEFGISYDIESVLENAKTRYYPICFDDVLREIKEKNIPFIFVGIPCHIKALNNIASADQEIERLIVARIGLFCGHMKTVNFARSLAAQVGISPNSIKYIDFRHKLSDRPANKYGVKIENNEGDIVIKSMEKIVGQDWGYGYFRLDACNYCDDVVAETADIAFGDAWLPAYVTDSAGTSVVVCRQPRLTALLEAGVREGRIALERIDADTVAESQAAGFRDRRDALRYRLWLASRRRLWRPRKRVEPGWRHLSPLRRLQLRLRAFVSRRSHRSWQLAERGFLKIFLFEGRALSKILHVATRVAQRRRLR